MRKAQILAAIAFFTFILWVIYMANTGESSVFFDVVLAIPFGDKLGHAGLFGTLTFLVVIASKFRGLMVRHTKWYFGVMAVCTFVIAEEISQSFIPSRTFDLTDLIADALGIMVAVLLLRRAEKANLRASSA